MEVDPLFGSAAPELGWVPAPRYSLRRARVLALVAALPRGRLLEVGCGAGALLRDLAQLGFDCQALETSDAARSLAGLFNSDLHEVTIHAAPAPDWSESFDLLLTLEVLEHLVDDRRALGEWAAGLRPGGTILISVPARMARWGASDVRVGHQRRYERGALAQLLDEAGFAVLHLECYGFPLSNATEAVGAWVSRRRLAAEGRRPDGGPSATARTAASGIERRLETRLYSCWRSAPGRLAFRFFCWLQERFLAHDLGTGYLALARRR